MSFFTPRTDILSLTGTASELKGLSRHHLRDIGIETTGRRRSFWDRAELKRIVR